jgi:hypothetical protein
MKRYYYILFLSIVFTAYLFSQTEENEIVKIDTDINIDSIAVTKTDTTVVEVDYLKTTDDTLAIDDCKKTGVISARVGSMLIGAIGSVTWDIPITCKTNFASKYFHGERSNTLIDGNITVFSGFGLGAGSVSKRTGNVIIKQNIYAILMYSKKDEEERVRPGLNMGMDIILWKVFSIGLDCIFVPGDFLPLLTLGLNILY